MKSREKIFHHLANLLVALSGVLYAWTRYFSTPADEFAVVNHPWQPALQQLHLLTAPILVFSMGILWSSHAYRMLMSGRQAKRRPTGLSLLGLAAPMIFSGYLIQITVDEDWRTAWIATHLISSGLWVVAYVWHRTTAVERGRKKSLV